MKRKFLPPIFLLSLPIFAHISHAGVELCSLGADLVVTKDGKRSKLLIGSRFMATVVGKEVGSICFVGQDGEVLQKAIDLLNQPPKVCGGSIWIKAGKYEMKEKRLVLPLPSYPYRIFGDGIDKTVLVYRGDGEAIGYGEALWKPAHNNVLELSDFTLRIEGNAKFGIRILVSNFSTVQRVRIIASSNSRPYCAISNEGAGGQTKLFRNIRIEGPFEIGIFISTDHMTLMQISVEGFRKYGILGGWDCLFSARLRGASGAIAGIAPPEAGAGYVRCEMSNFDLNIREFYWRHIFDNWGRGAIADIEDLTPPMKGYAVIYQPRGWAVISFRKPPLAKISEGKGVVSVVEQRLWEKICPRIPAYIDELPSEPSVVVFKDGRTCKAQVVSDSLAKSLGVPVGTAIVSSNDDAEVLQKVCDILPSSGKLILEEGTYNLSHPVKVCRKELAIEGQRRWCHLVYDPQAGKELPPPRAGTVVNAKEDAFVIEDASKFQLAHLQFNDVGGTAIKLARTSAFIHDVGLARCSWPGIVIDGGKGSVISMVTGGGEPAIEDKGEGTLVIACQHWCGVDRKNWAVRIGKFGAVIGGHVNFNAITTQKMGVENFAVVIGNMAEGGSKTCYVADSATLYLLGAGGGFPGVAEFDGGKVVVVGK
jgi:hypothetical protein